MNTKRHINDNDISFKHFLFYNKRNRITLCLAGTAIIIQFAIFKYLYPFASYIHGDSFSYITAADKNLNINTYLIGYSKFLRLLSVFSKSDIIVAACQYLLLQCSVLFLLFSLFYFYRPSKVVQTILVCFMVSNPLLLHLANLISSDGLFLSLSMTWFSLLLWIIFQPSFKIIILHALVLFFAFTIRYNSLIYPIISLLAFAFSNLSIKQKLTGFSFGLALCAMFILFTSYNYKKLTGHWQYSPFSGWQFTNNAMYAYRYVDSADRKPVTKKFETFDKKVRKYFDNHRDIKKYAYEKIKAGTFYMWSPGLPMMSYRDSIFNKDTLASDFKKWATLAPFYKSYGIYIIKKYPFHFIKYFIWPNTIKYYSPPVEFLSRYNSGKSSVNEQTKQWFEYNSTAIKTRMKNNKSWTLYFYPILSGIINVIMLLTLIYYIVLKGWRTDNKTSKIIFLGSMVWILNALFTISASSAALRFQSFPILLTTIFSMLLLEWLIRVATSNNPTVSSKEEQPQIQDLQLIT